MLGIKYCFVLVLVVLQSNQSIGVTVIKKNNNLECHAVPSSTLSDVLGGAFNSRYMSIDAPKEKSGKTEDGGKRAADDDDASDDESFAVDEDFTNIDSDKPAWPRRKRSTRSKLQNWQCQSTIRWTDLGPDYFPRFLRSVECKPGGCYHNIFKCKPRSFTVKILRRRQDKCVVAKVGTTLGLEGLPLDLRDLWLWEERAITFCCDCVL